MSHATTIGLRTAIFAALAFTALPASAQDAPEESAATASEAAADEAWAFDVDLGASLMSDYIFRGITQTDHGPALQAYFDPSYGIFYAGIFATNVDYHTSDPDLEIDLYIGARPELGPVSTDFSYLHYFYPGASDSNYSEVTAAASILPTEMLTLRGEFDYSWDYVQSGDDATYLEGSAALALPNGFGISAAAGYQMFGSGVGLSDYLTWNVGASYEWEAVTFDLRYHDTDLSSGTCGAEYPRANACDARIVASIAVDTSWSALRALRAPSP